MEDRFRYLFKLRINHTFFPKKAVETVAYNIAGAMRNLAYRYVKCKTKARVVANEVIHRGAYIVLSKTPVYSDIYDTEKYPDRPKKDQEVSLREISDEMDEIESIKNVIDDYPINPDEEEDE